MVMCLNADHVQPMHRTKMNNMVTRGVEERVVDIYLLHVNTTIIYYDPVKSEFMCGLAE